MKTERKNLVMGFTIVELLTVMSIIALLLGILVPALNMVRRIAKDTRQKAQFHSISVALEAYAGDMEQYPASAVQPNTDGVPDAPPLTVGAHHLAEALLGRDFLGFDPWTTWNAEIDKANPDIYATEEPPLNSSPDQVAASLDRRKGPYLDSESVEAYQIEQLYGTNKTGDVYTGNIDETGNIIAGECPAPVLTDSYRVKTVSLPNAKQVKAGSPILYYRANVTSREFHNSLLPAPGGAILDPAAAASIYNSMDNEALLDLGVITDTTKPQHFSQLDYTAYKTNLTGRECFYDTITNSKVTTQVRPYNQRSYILISAGFDSIFGTPDDIFNFSE